MATFNNIPTDFVPGTKAKANEVDANLSYVNPGVHQVFTGSTFDSTTASTSPDENSVELTAITTANLTNKQYVKISITGSGEANGQQVATKVGLAEIKIQVKETGGSYGDDLAYVNFIRVDAQGAGDVTEINNSGTLVWIHALTAGDLSNGVQFKIFSKSTGATGSNRSSFTNIQTIVEVIGG